MKQIFSLLKFCEELRKNYHPDRGHTLSRGNKFPVKFGVKEFARVLSGHDFDQEALGLYRDGREVHPNQVNGLPPRRKSYHSRQWLWETTGLLKTAQETGSAVKMSQASNYDPELARLSAAFSQTFHCGISLNAYFGPASSKCFEKHSDPYDVYILQMEGEKLWNVDEWQGTSKRHVLLKKGDILFIPKGCPHEAISKNSDSLHLTVGLNAYRLRHHFETLLNELLETKLSIGAESDAHFKELRSLTSLAAKTLQQFDDRKLKLSETRLSTPAHLLPAHSAKFSSSTKVKFIDVPYHLEKKSGHFLFQCAGIEMELPDDRNLLKTLFSGKAFTSDSLSRKFPGIDEKSILRFLRHLYQKGLLTETP